MIPKKLTDEIERWISERKHGHLQINFSAGKIMNVNRLDCVRLSQGDNFNSTDPQSPKTVNTTVTGQPHALGDTK